MTKHVLKIEARRECYSIDQIYSTMTVGELISYLEQLDEEMPVYFSHDNGYTFGSVNETDFLDEVINEEEEG